MKLLHEQEYANKLRSILRDYGNSGFYPEPKNLTLNPLQLRQELNLNNSGLYPEPKNLTLNPLQLRQELNLNNSGLYPVP